MRFTPSLISFNLLVLIKIYFIYLLMICLHTNDDHKSSFT